MRLERELLRDAGMTRLLLILALSGCSSPGQAGDECACTSDCGGGLYCTPEADPPLDLGSACDGDPVGRCTPLRGEGESCDAVADTRCAPDLRCVAAVCVAEWGSEGDACGTDADCDAGLTCNDAVSPPACRPPGGEGESCTTEDDCDPSLVCNTGPESPVCGPPAALDTPCAEDQDCAEGLWCREAGCAYLSCGNGRCAALGTGEPGDACRVNEDCASGVCALVDEGGFQTLRCS
jgi:hypothetical protein